MAKVNDPTDYDKPQIDLNDVVHRPDQTPPTTPRKKKRKPGGTVGGDLQGSTNRGKTK